MVKLPHMVRFMVSKFGQARKSSSHVFPFCNTKACPIFHWCDFWQSTVRATAYRTLPEDNITGYVFPDPEPDPWTPERVITHLPPNPKSRNKLLYHETSLLPENRTAAYIGLVSSLSTSIKHQNFNGLFQIQFHTLLPRLARFIKKPSYLDLL